MADLQEKSIELWREEAWKLHAKIRKLEDALRKIKALHHGPEDDDVLHIRDDMTYQIVCDTLEAIDRDRQLPSRD